MNRKILIVIISAFFCIILLNTAIAYNAYINVIIVDLNTNTTAESDPIELVDHANSAIEWQVNGTGCDDNDGTWNNDIAVGEYGNGDRIVMGSPASLNEGSTCNFFLRVDEVKVGTNYYGSCTTDTTSSQCTTCKGGGASCRVDGTSYGTPTNAWSYFQTIGSAGADGSACNVNSNFGRCSDEIVDQLDVSGTTKFGFSFTA